MAKIRLNLSEAKGMEAKVAPPEPYQGTWYFTFYPHSPNYGCYVKIRASDREKARLAMMGSRFGARWEWQWRSEEFLTEYDIDAMKELPLLTEEEIAKKASRKTLRRKDAPVN